MAPFVAPNVSSAASRTGPRPRPGTRAGPTGTLVVESGGPGAPLLGQVLAEAGLAARSVSPRGLRSMARLGFACVVLDAEGLGPDLLDVVGRLARHDPAPRVLVVVPSTSPDRVTLMRAGADDVVPAPVCPRELVARVRRLVAPPVVAPTPLLELGCLVIDRDRREVWVDGVEVVLAPRRYQLLVALAEAAGEPVPGSVLLGRFWDPHQRVSGTHLRPQVARLRTALGDRCEITWVKRVGYVLRCSS